MNAPKYRLRLCELDGATRDYLQACRNFGHAVSGGVYVAEGLYGPHLGALIFAVVFTLLGVNLSEQGDWWVVGVVSGISLGVAAAAVAYIFRDWILALRSGYLGRFTLVDAAFIWEVGPGGVCVSPLDGLAISHLTQRYLDGWHESGDFEIATTSGVIRLSVFRSGDAERVHSFLWDVIEVCQRLRVRAGAYAAADAPGAPHVVGSLATSDLAADAAAPRDASPVGPPIPDPIGLRLAVVSERRGSLRLLLWLGAFSTLGVLVMFAAGKNLP